MSAPALIHMEGVSKDYALGKTVVHALQDIELSIASGEFTVIAGSSGSGKTTLLNLIGLIDTCDTGRLRLGHLEIDGDPASLARLRRDRLGYIFQTFNLIPVMNVYENVAYPLILQKVPTRERRERVEEMLAAVGLHDRQRHKPRELSGGQRQRVAIARALVKHPDLVLADEPTANLDSATGEEVLNLMQRLHRRLNTTFLFSSHDPMVIAKATRVIRLHDGMIASKEEAA